MTSNAETDTPTPPIAGAELPTERETLLGDIEWLLAEGRKIATDEAPDEGRHFDHKFQAIRRLMTGQTVGISLRYLERIIAALKATSPALPESRPLTISDDLPDLLFRRCGLSQEDTLKLAEEIRAMVKARPEASLEKALRRQKESHESIAAVLREGATATGLTACIAQCEQFAEEARKLIGCVAVAAMLFCTGCSPCPYPTDCKIGVDCNHCKRGLCRCCDGQCWCDAARTNQ